MNGAGARVPAAAAALAQPPSLPRAPSSTPPPSFPFSLRTCRLGLLLLRPRQAGAHEGPRVLLGGELLEASGGELVHLLLALRPATQRAAVRPGGAGSPLHHGPCSPGAVDAGPPALAHRVEHGAVPGDKAGVAEHGHEPTHHRAARPPSAPPPRPTPTAAPLRLRGRRARGSARASYGPPERPNNRKSRSAGFCMARLFCLVGFVPFPRQ